MTYSDCFWILGVGLIVLLPIVLVLPRKAVPGQAPSPATAAPNTAGRGQATGAA